MYHFQTLLVKTPLALRKTRKDYHSLSASARLFEKSVGSSNNLCTFLLAGYYRTLGNPYKSNFMSL